MIKSFINLHCGEKNKVPILIGFILFFAMLSTTLLFTYHDILHIVALGLQIIFFGYNVFLFFKTKNYNFSFLIFIVPFAISVAISLILNGYNSNYNTIASELLIFISIVYFAQTIPNKKDCFSIVKICLVIFVFYFLIVYFMDFVTLVKSNDFSDVRFGDKIAPINMITIYFDLVCAFVFLATMQKFKSKKILYAIILLFIYVISFLCGVSTGSKQFIVVTLVVNLISLIWFFGKRRWYISLAIIVSLLLLSIFLLTLPIFSTIAERFKSMFDLLTEQEGSDYSSATRIMMFNEAIYLFTKRPVFGYGLWGYAINGSYGTYSHNTLSNILCEFGAIGFFTFGFLVFGPILMKLAKNKKDFFIDKSVWIALLCIVIQFAFGVLYSHKITFVITAISCIYFYDGSVPKIKNVSHLPQIENGNWLSINI